ncbi:MAG: protein kinase family protein [Gemmatimonadetes bacterium]|nr:protein kinase family protein [Gemmatimonadota bacterium]
MPSKIDTYDFQEGRVLAGKYEVAAKLGKGWEGEVYRVTELETGIQRAAKFFYPERNVKNRALRKYAQKLHRLQHVPILMQYVTPEKIRFRGEPISFLVSEYYEGILLTDMLKSRRGKRLDPFQAGHFLYALAAGVEILHDSREYHGDIHSDNIIVQRHGLQFDLKLIDCHFRPGSATMNILADVIDLVNLFHEIVGGRKHYASQPPVVKEICCGLKHSLIEKKFRNAGQLRRFLERLDWS